MDGRSPMQFRSCGKSGLKLSCLGLGTFATFGNQIDDEKAEKLVHLAYENGINYFDTSELYAAGKAEIVLGRILKNSGWKRSSYVISTKVYWGGKSVTEVGLSRKHVIEGLEASLERLQLENVDIVFANKFDPNTPMEETVRAFNWLIDKGKAYYWGTCQWSPSEIMEAYCVARQFNLIPPVCDQSEYHMFQRIKIETQMSELFHKIGIGCIGWSALASGILTNKYKYNVPPNSRATLKGFEYLENKIATNGSDEGIQQQKLNELEFLAKALGFTLPQLAIGWCLKNEGVSCILLGASTVEQLKEDISSLKILQLLTPNVLMEVERILNTNISESQVIEQPN